MIKILLYGVMSEKNFGGPSLMHGAEEIIKEIHKEYEIVCYQSTKPVDIAISDMGFKVYQVPYKKPAFLLLDAIKFKLGIRPKTKEQFLFLNHIKTSDIVANLYGICFCSNFAKGKYSYIGSIKSVIGKYAINFVAKIYGIKSVKCPASYGPIKSRTDKMGAKFSAKYIFDIMYSREYESKKQIENVYNKKQIPVSPDLANYMRHNANNIEKIIGISVSYQIIRQWNSPESYIDCMVYLIKHIINTIKYRIILIPNEFMSDTDYHDINVANDMYKFLKYNKKVEILDVENMNSTQLKDYIAKCEIMIASRYHSCVAALSLGVPTLIVGWHYKYNELLKWYGQEQWIISSENCNSDKLIQSFDKFWIEREKNRIIIRKHYEDVQDMLINAGKDLFIV
jgi:polysaccharide pyruvyl transferase WcaK-like protein